jgi:ABC-type lipoprotein release transport system permease subunit
LVLALGASVSVVLVASIYPAWQASRLSPSLAMRPV